MVGCNYPRESELIERAVKKGVWNDGNRGNTEKLQMRLFRLCAACFLLATLTGACATPARSKPEMAAQKEKPWFGVHLYMSGRNVLPDLKRTITEWLAPNGVNVLILEVNYMFAFQSRPELSRSDDAITKEDARELSALCRSLGIKLIPQFNCLGHQSWGNKGGTFPLLAKYPELDETPWIPHTNEGIYCRSWCPLEPKVNELVFPLIDELIDAFQPEAFHVGMDEVFLIADSKCPRCGGKNPAEVFANAVNDLHRHIVGEKKLTMFMWGDRLIDMAAMDYGMFESSRNGTAAAIDMIPKDIIVCDWHYGRRPEYPSVTLFQEKGFRVWPASWNTEKASLALLKYARKTATPKMIGHLCTTWCSIPDFAKGLQEKNGDPRKKDPFAAFLACARMMKQR